MWNCCIFSGGLGLKEKLVLTEILSEEKIGETTQILIRIFTFTFMIELIGSALIYFFRFGEETFSFVQVFESVFYSVVAFGNAGFSLNSEGLLLDFNQGKYYFLSVIMILCFLGSLGFPVLINIYNKNKQNENINKYFFRGKISVRKYQR